MKANTRTAIRATRAKAQKPSFEICILAGGLSTRMGSDKSRALLGRKTLLQHVRAAAESTGLPVRIIRRDAVPRCGPLGGIYTALGKTKADCVLFLPCDMPFVSGKLLERMLKRWNSFAKLTPPPHPGPLPQWGRGGRRADSNASHSPAPIAMFATQKSRAGFPFILRREAALSILREQIKAGQYSLQTLAKKLDAKPFRASSRELANINTPAELKMAAHRHSANPGG